MNLELTDVRQEIDDLKVYEWLVDSYWAGTRTLDEQKFAMDNSLNFAAKMDGKTVAFARLVTDFSTFGWLCDVIVAPEFRGQGIGHRLVQFVLDHPSVRSVRRLLLGTRDAHSLYRDFGFVEAEPGRLMFRGFQKLCGPPAND